MCARALLLFSCFLVSPSGHDLAVGCARIKSVLLMKAEWPKRTIKQCTKLQVGVLVLPLFYIYIYIHIYLYYYFFFFFFYFLFYFFFFFFIYFFLFLLSFLQYRVCCYELSSRPHYNFYPVTGFASQAIGSN